MIELKNISKTYSNGKISFQALKNIDLEIKQGEFVAIMGASGSGKSTLLHILGFLDNVNTGSYKFLGYDVSRLDEEQLSVMRNKVAGFVFQQFHLLPGLNALENASLPQIYSHKKVDINLALQKLASVGLKPRVKHLPNELSGGERQRVAIARALVNQPVIIFADEPTGNLDLKSEAEIINILKGLNDAGITIVMVTHEQEIASHAKRIINMRDGIIISDKKIEEIKQATQSNQNYDIDRFLKEGKNKNNYFEFISHVKEAIRSMFVNKLRTSLSMLGISIGVAAVIAMMALGSGATKAIEKDLANLGSNLLTIRPGDASRSGGISQGVGSYSRFTFRDVNALKNIAEVSKITGQVSSRAQVVYQNKNWQTSILGVNAEYEAMYNSNPVLGRFFNQEELNKRERVALIGQTAASELFKNESAIGKTVKINKINFRIIGVLPKKGFAMGGDRDDVLIIPITTAMYRLMGKNYIDSLAVEIKSKELIEIGKENVRKVLYRLHNLNLSDQRAINIRDMTEIQNAIKSTTNTISLLLGSVAGIALFVGGIGIMNIMLVSVTERTKEIGLRKALGANKSDIMSQFLIESIVMTFTGGGFGVVLGAIIASFISIFLNWATEVSLMAVIISLGFSVAVGLIFGIMPARQAANLNTIDALRYE